VRFILSPLRGWGELNPPVNRRAIINGPYQTLRAENWSWGNVTQSWVRGGIGVTFGCPLRTNDNRPGFPTPGRTVALVSQEFEGIVRNGRVELVNGTLLEGMRVQVRVKKW